jgi:hypothetical protein
MIRAASQATPGLQFKQLTLMQRPAHKALQPAPLLLPAWQAGRHTRQAQRSMQPRKRVTLLQLLLLP